jgi:hypothetical protein
LNKDQELKFRKELEEAGEASVRADFYGRGDWRLAARIGEKLFDSGLEKKNDRANGTIV